MAYDRNIFVGGSDVLSLTLMEIQIWQWYNVYVKRSKIDRLEFPMAYSAYGSMCDKTKKRLKLTEFMAMPEKIKKTALEMFHRHNKFKPKKR